MNILIFGANSIGLNIARRCVKAGDRVMVLSSEKTALIGGFENAGCDVTIINQNDLHAILEAGKANIDTFLALSESSETNIAYCKLMGLSLGIQNRIAKVSEQEYFPELGSYVTKEGFEDLNSMGTMISAEKGLADRIVFNAHFSGAKNVFNAFGRRYVFVQLIVEKDELSIEAIESTDGAILIGIGRGGTFIEKANLEDGLQRGDSAYLIIDRKSFPTLAKLLTNKRVQARANRPHSCTIGGGGYSGRLIASRIQKERSARQITIVEKDEDRSIALAEEFPDIDVVNGNILDWGLMENIGIGETDLYISATSDGPSNIVSAYVAKGMGCQRSICALEDISYEQSMNSLAIDLIVNANSIFADRVISILYASGTSRLSSFHQDKLFCCEIEIKENSKAIGNNFNRIIKSYELHPLMVESADGSIIRHEEQKSYKLRAGDKLLVWSKFKQIKGLKKITSSFNHQKAA